MESFRVDQNATRHSKVPDYAVIESRMQQKALQETRNGESEQRREAYFEQFIATKMLSRLEDDLEELDVEPEIITKIVDSAYTLSFDDIYRALSYPYDLRTSFLSKLVHRIHSGHLKPEHALSDMATTARRYGFSIGFHMSLFDIKPSSKGWAIRGTEADHRDNDLPMAYYARKFKSLYRRKLASYVYIVRAEDSHRVGEDGKWWRAPSLSIVQKIPLDELRHTMNHLNREFAEQHAVEHGSEK